MYKITFVKYAILDNKEKGNIPQGYETAYMDCGLDGVEKKLNRYLAHEDMYAVVRTAEKINAIIVR